MAAAAAEVERASGEQAAELEAKLVAARQLSEAQVGLTLTLTLTLTLILTLTLTLTLTDSRYERLVSGATTKTNPRSEIDLLDNLSFM